MSYIMINEHHRVKMDKYNFILEKLYNVVDKKTKKEKNEWKSIGYYGSTEHLFIAMAERAILDNDGKITKIMKALQEIKQLIKSMEHNVLYTGKERVIVKEKIITHKEIQYWECFPKDKRKKAKLIKKETIDEKGVKIKERINNKEKNNEIEESKNGKEEKKNGCLF